MSEDCMRMNILLLSLCWRRVYNREASELVKNVRVKILLDIWSLSLLTQCEWTKDSSLCTRHYVHLLQEKVNHLTWTIQNLWVLTNALCTVERDPCKRTMTAHRENRQNVPWYKPLLLHDTEPVYDILVQTNTLNTMTNTTVMGLIFPRSHSTDSWKTAEGKHLTFCQSIHGNIKL